MDYCLKIIKISARQAIVAQCASGEAAELLSGKRGTGEAA